MPGQESVKVAVRIRPMSQSEQARGCQTVVKQATPNFPHLLVGNGRTPWHPFAYNYVFPPSALQSQVYEEAISPMLHKLFAGYNATILSYGQRSSGKTFTMGTDFIGEMDSNVGVIPRAINEIFCLIADGTEAAVALVDTRITCSFIEVYQDQVYDLLTENAIDIERHPVNIREAAGGNIILEGLTEVPVNDKQCALDCLTRGSFGRASRNPAMNNVSTRSHAIFTLTMHHTAKDDPTMVTHSKFRMVDLAGSERSKKTKSSGSRFKEGVEINKCLLALGNVITALGSSVGSSKGHIPYRSSKLTRLLQDSLGGNSYTLMIACVSPTDYNLSDTYSTLRYASQVRTIKNKPIINQDPPQARIKQLKAIIHDMREEILSLKKDEDKKLGAPQHGNAGLTSSTSPSYKQLQEENRLLQLQLQAKMQELEANEIRVTSADRFLEDIEQLLKPQGKAGVPKDEMHSKLAALLAREKRSKKIEECWHKLQQLETEVADLFRPSVRIASEQAKFKEEDAKRIAGNLERIDINEPFELGRRLAATLAEWRNLTEGNTHDQAVMRRAEAACWVWQIDKVMFSTVKAMVPLFKLQNERAKKVKHIEQIKAQCARLQEGSAKHKKLRRQILQNETDLEYSNTQINDLKTNILATCSESLPKIIDDRLAKLPNGSKVFNRMLIKLVEASAFIIVA
ncbi:chromosome-associated kinesin KIF4 [Anopheles gambiae]|uniref:chromosome-associated kinesin KIF4 n=1 Tax=Anopheles gambiae TaxID=7165 RepID=UPI002AC8CD5A|nr:chromosome-associated kinesin KIF4 [Anopheles gambiae]